MKRIRHSAERLNGHGLLGCDLTGSDRSDEEVLAARGRSGEAAHHGNLAYVCERIGNRPLEERLGAGMELLV